MAQEGCEASEWPKRGTSRELPAPQGQPEGSCGGLPGAEETTPELSNSIQQLQQEAEAGHPQGQRQAVVLEPGHGEPTACQDTQEQELEPAEVLATTESLKRDLDFCRDVNRKQLAQLQQQECAVEQEHQDLVLLMQQFQALKDKVSGAPFQLKDQAVQTEVTSYMAAYSHSDTRHDISVESRKQLEQLGTQEQSKQATEAQEQQSPQQQVQDTANLQAQLAQTQNESAKQEQDTAVDKTQRQSKQQVSSLQERLQELSRQAQHWQQLHVDSERALALREEQLVVCKVELAFLKEELSRVAEETQATNRHSRYSRQDGKPTFHSQNI